MTSRIPPLEPPYTDAIQADFDVIMPPGVPPLAIFRTVAHNPRVLNRMIKGGLLDKGSISVADRELVILRSCGRCQAEYEWGVHLAAYSAKAGLSQEQIADTLNPTANEALWSPEQRLLLRLVDQLHETQNVDDPLWSALSGYYEPNQLIELIMLTGLYHAVSFVVNVCRIEREPFAPTFPVQ